MNVVSSSRGSAASAEGGSGGVPSPGRRIAPVAAGLVVVGAVISVFSCWPSITNLASPVAVVLLMGFGARILGKWIHRGDLEEDILAGLLMLSLVPIINQLSGLRLAPGAWWIVLLGLAAMGLLESMKGGDGRRVFQRLEKDAEDSGLFGVVFFLPAVLALTWALLPTLAPPAGMDTLTYHLGLPSQYLARGTLAPPDGLVYYQYTQAGEMLALLGLAADETGRASTLLLGLTMVLAAISGGRFAAELAMGSERRSRSTTALARVLGFAAVATMPVALFTVAHGKTDALTIALALAGARRAVTRSSCPYRAAFLLGGAVAAKLTAVYIVIPALVLVLFSVRRRPIVILSVLVLVALAPSYWLIRNWLHFGSLVPQAHHMVEAARGSIGPGIAERFMRLFGSTFLLVGQGIDGPVGAPAAALLAFLALGFRTRRRDLRHGALIACASLVAWLVSGGGSHAYAQGGLLRFLLPGIAVGLAVGAAGAAEVILPRGGRTASGALLGSLVAFGLFLNAIAVFGVLGRAFPAVDVLTGRMSEQEYRRVWLSSSGIQGVASRVLPADARVYSLGEPRLFTMRRAAFFDVEADRPRVYRALAGSGGDTGVLDDLARREAWTHVFHYPDGYAISIMNGQAPTPADPGDRARFEGWLAARSRLLIVDERENAFLFELIPDSFPARP